MTIIKNLHPPVVAPEWFDRAIEHTPESYFFYHNDVKLHYLQWHDQHSANNDQKPVLLFLHGFRGHARWWSFIAPFFTSKYSVYALDFSGMGDSGSSHYHADNHAEEILAFIEHLSLSSITVVGHSFGGGRAFRAAARQPQHFKKIIAIDSHITFSDDQLGTDPAPQLAAKFYSSKDIGLSRFRLVPAQSEQQAYLVDYIAKYSLKAIADQWTWKFDPALLVDDITSSNGEEILAAVHCQVDYIYCDQSAVVSRPRAEKIQRYLANPGHFIVVPGGHHHLMVSQPVALICTLQALL